MSKKRGMFSDDDTAAPEPTEPIQKDDPKVIVEATLPEAAKLIAEPAAPARELPMIPLDVFCGASGKRPDQTKGFKGWAKREGLTSLTMPAWHEQWQKFQNRPV